MMGDNRNFSHSNERDTADSFSQVHRMQITAASSKMIQTDCEHPKMTLGVLPIAPSQSSRPASATDFAARNSDLCSTSYGDNKNVDINLSDAMMIMYKLTDLYLERQKRIQSQLLVTVDPDIVMAKTEDSAPLSASDAEASYSRCIESPRKRCDAPVINSNKRSHRPPSSMPITPSKRQSSDNTEVHAYDESRGDAVRIFSIEIGNKYKPLEFRIIYVSGRNKYYFHTTQVGNMLCSLGLGLRSSKWIRARVQDRLEITQLPIYMQDNGRAQISNLVHASMGDIISAMENSNMQFQETDQQRKEWLRIRQVLLSHFKPCLSTEYNKPFGWIQDTDTLAANMDSPAITKSNSAFIFLNEQTVPGRDPLSKDSSSRHPKKKAKCEAVSGETEPRAGERRPSYTTNSVLKATSADPSSTSTISLSSNLHLTATLPPATTVHNFHPDAGDHGFIAYRSVSILGHCKNRYELHLFFIGMERVAVVMEEDDDEDSEDSSTSRSTQATDDTLNDSKGKQALVEIEPLFRCIRIFQQSMKRAAQKALGDLVDEAIQSVAQKWCVEGLAERSFPKLTTQHGVTAQPDKIRESNEAMCVTLQGVQLICDQIESDANDLDHIEPLELSQIKSMARNLCRDVESTLKLAAQYLDQE